MFGKNPGAHFAYIAWTWYNVFAVRPCLALSMLVNICWPERPKGFVPRRRESFVSRLKFGITWTEKVRIKHKIGHKDLPGTNFDVSAHPRRRCSSGFFLRKSCTSGPAWIHSPATPFHHPPLTWCLKRSMSLIVTAISCDGARWLESILHKRNIAFQHSKTSVEKRTAGPNRRISSTRWGRTCNLNFTIMRFGSWIAQRSRTFAINTSRSA